MKTICLLISILFATNISFSSAQTAPNIGKDTIRNLVLSGGGTWGIAYCGALQEMQNRGKLKDLKRVAGTSVGAIAATALAVGYPTEELTKLIEKLNVEAFNDQGFPVVGGLVRMSTGFGWFKGIKFEKWVDQLIKNKTGNGSLTFAQLHEMTKTHPYLDLYITGTDLTQQKMVIFSFETYPDMKIKDAVRISMCVPFYFSAVLMDKYGNLVKKRTSENQADVMIDGGVINNYPIEIFDHEKYIGINSGSNAQEFNKGTVGIRVQRDSQITYDSKGMGLAPFEIHTFKDFVIAFYTFTIEKLNKEGREPENIHRTIAISTLHYSQRVRHISIKQKTDLFESGRKATKDFFEGRK